MNFALWLRGPVWTPPGGRKRLESVFLESPECVDEFRYTGRSLGGPGWLPRAICSKIGNTFSSIFWSRKPGFCGLSKIRMPSKARVLGGHWGLCAHISPPNYQRIYTIRQKIHLDTLFSKMRAFSTKMRTFSTQMSKFEIAEFFQSCLFETSPCYKLPRPC